MLRTFIACKIPPTPALRGLHSDLQELGRPVRPVAMENLHITLKFLGDTDPLQIPAISEILREVVAGCEQFLIEMRGLGVFPNPKRPTVVWVGMQGGESLTAMAEAFEQRLQELGFPQESRKFEPHLTVARVRGRAPRELATYLEQQRETNFCSEIIGSVELYKSELTPTGSCYTILAQENLG